MRTTNTKRWGPAFARDFGYRVALSIGLTFLVVLLSSSALAQPGGMGMCDGCSGMMGGSMGPMMWIGMAVAWLIGIAIVAALVALTVYLVRRSKL